MPYLRGLRTSSSYPALQSMFTHCCPEMGGSRHGDRRVRLQKSPRIAGRQARTRTPRWRGVRQCFIGAKGDVQCPQARVRHHDLWEVEERPALSGCSILEFPNVQDNDRS